MKSGSAQEGLHSQNCHGKSEGWGNCHEKAVTGNRSGEVAFLGLQLLAQRGGQRTELVMLELRLLTNVLPWNNK